MERTTSFAFWSHRSRIQGMSPGVWWKLIAVLAVCGCNGRGAAQYTVSGEATYQGNPIPVGRIVFQPQDGPGPSGVAKIRNGQYATLVDRGSVGGAYEVVIYGYDGQDIDVDEDRSSGTPLFPPHRDQIKLPEKDAEVDFDVP